MAEMRKNQGSKLVLMVASGFLIIGPSVVLSASEINAAVVNITKSINTIAEARPSLNKLVGSQINGAIIRVSGSAKIINKSKVTRSTNLAKDGGEANMGSIKIQGSKVQGKVINKSKVIKSRNVAIGKGATANMGSIKIKGSMSL